MGGGRNRALTRAYIKFSAKSAVRRRVVVHYHPRKTYVPGLLKAPLEATVWSEKDLKRLKLIK